MLKFFQKYGWVIALVIAIIAIFTPAKSGNLGSLATNYDKVDTLDGYLVDGTTVINGSGNLIIGSSGSTITKIITGTFTNTSCTGTATQAATTTTTYECSVTGATADDKVFVTLASTTPAGPVLSTAYASTTASNKVRVVLYNASSSATSATTTGAKYLIVR